MRQNARKKVSIQQMIRDRKFSINIESKFQVKKEKHIIKIKKNKKQAKKFFKKSSKAKA
jgi:hypothetical protein